MPRRAGSARGLMPPAPCSVSWRPHWRPPRRMNNPSSLVLLQPFQAVRDSTEWARPARRRRRPIRFHYSIILSQPPWASEEPRMKGSVAVRLSEARPKNRDSKGPIPPQRHRMQPEARLRRQAERGPAPRISGRRPGPPGPGASGLRGLPGGGGTGLPRVCGPHSRPQPPGRLGPGRRVPGARGLALASSAGRPRPFSRDGPRPGPRKRGPIASMRVTRIRGPALWSPSRELGGRRPEGAAPGPSSMAIIPTARNSPGRSGSSSWGELQPSQYGGSQRGEGGENTLAPNLKSRSASSMTQARPPARVPAGFAGGPAGGALRGWLR